MILSIHPTEDTEENNKKFESIYNKYYNYAYTIAYNILHDVQQMEDVMQTIFLCVWKILSKMTDDQSTKALISTIARNSAINAGKKMTRDSGNKIDIDDDVMYATTTLADSDPLDIVISKENLQNIYNQIKSMKKIYADVLLLKYKFNFSPEQISELLDINVKTVYTRLERGGGILKNALKSKERRS